MEYTTISQSNGGTAHRYVLSAPKAKTRLQYIGFWLLLGGAYIFSEQDFDIEAVMQPLSLVYFLALVPVLLLLLLRPCIELRSEGSIHRGSMVFNKVWWSSSIHKDEVSEIQVDDSDLSNILIRLLDREGEPELTIESFDSMSDLRQIQSHLSTFINMAIGEIRVLPPFYKDETASNAFLITMGILGVLLCLLLLASIKPPLSSTQLIGTLAAHTFLIISYCGIYFLPSYGIIYTRQFSISPWKRKLLFWRQFYSIDQANDGTKTTRLLKKSLDTNIFILMFTVCLYLIIASYKATHLPSNPIDEREKELDDLRNSEEVQRGLEFYKNHRLQKEAQKQGNRQPGE